MFPALTYKARNEDNEHENDTNIADKHGKKHARKQLNIAKSFKELIKDKGCGQARRFDNDSFL